MRLLSGHSHCAHFLPREGPEPQPRALQTWPIPTFLLPSLSSGAPLLHQDWYRANCCGSLGKTKLSLLKGCSCPVLCHAGPTSRLVGLNVLLTHCEGQASSSIHLESWRTTQVACPAHPRLKCKVGAVQALYLGTSGTVVEYLVTQSIA